jgi:hypothetical protein
MSIGENYKRNITPSAQTFRYLREAQVLGDQISTVYDCLLQTRNEWKLVAGQLVPTPQE